MDFFFYFCKVKRVYNRILINSIYMTRKFTLLLLLVSMLIPMTLCAQQIEKDVLTDMKVRKDNSTMLKKKLPASANKQVQELSMSTMDTRAPKAAPSANVRTWDFEWNNALDEWTIVDNDNDGRAWNHFNNKTSVTGKMTTHDGHGVLYSESYNNDNFSPLTPDNWLISPEVTLGGVLSLWACGQSPEAYAEVFGVFVCVGNSTDPADFVQVGADITTTSEMTEYSFDLSQFAEQTGRFAIRHYNCTNQFYLNIDDVCLDVNATYMSEPTNPTNLTVSPAATTADVAWDGAEGDSWNLRYKVNNPNEKGTLLWDLTRDNYESQFEGWSVEDRDDDGYNWGLAYNDFDPKLDDLEDVCFYSKSWDQNSDALTPNNWLYTPELPLGGTFTFWAKNEKEGYHDVLGVYVVTDGEEVQIGADFTPPLDWTKYTFDTSGYSGKVGKIAIVHHNCNNQYGVNVDYISYEKPGDEPAEWIEVNGLTDPNYTIEGLEPGTQYMVEVQAYTEKGETEWTEPTYFKTLEEDVDVYVTLDETSSDNSGVISANNGETCNVILTRRIVPGSYNTLCLPFDVDNALLKEKFGEDVELAELSDTHMDNETLYFDFAPADAITAGVPYLIYVSNAVESPITFNAVTVKEGTQPVTTSLADFIPVFDVTTLDNGNENILFLGANNTLYNPSTTSGAMKGFRAYFKVKGEAQGAKAMVMMDNSLTGVKTILNENLQNEQVYDLQGRMVTRPAKGLYIMNGKKVIIR